MGVHASGQGLSGTYGLFHTPVALVPEDKTLLVGAHFLDKHYSSYKIYFDKNQAWDGLATFASIAFLPRLEVQIRYTHLLNREISPATKYFPDRMLSVRYQALRERGFRPAVTVGMQDCAYQFGFASTSYFAANYVVASKTLEVSGLRVLTNVGYGFGLRPVERLQLEGVFAGLALGHTKLSGADILLEFDSRYWNVGGRVLLFKRLQILAGWYDWKAFSGGLSWRWSL